MKDKDIYVFSRKKLLDSYKEMNKDSCLISVSDIDKKNLNLNYFKNENYFKFNDIDFKNEKSINLSIGRKIYNLIISHNSFVINCEYGISRSAGIAMAIECIKKYNSNIEEYILYKSGYINNKKYKPNLFVFYTIMEASYDS